MYVFIVKHNDPNRLATYVLVSVCPESKSALQTPLNVMVHNSAPHSPALNFKGGGGLARQGVHSLDGVLISRGVGGFLRDYTVYSLQGETI